MASASNQPSPTLFCLINLGCAKNQVDSECLLASMIQSGFVLTPDPAEADLCLVNTCGFIQDARDEARGVFEELQECKTNGHLQYIVALGCLVERAADVPEFQEDLAPCDAAIGFQQFSQLPAICKKLIEDAAAPATRALSGNREQRKLPADYMELLDLPRLLIGPSHSAFLKIAEGCSNTCQFCSIPLIRGKQVSRAPAALLHEAEQLLGAGVCEINLIAQDTSAYGKDLPDHPSLTHLLGAMAQLPHEAWIRLLYSYPHGITAPLLEQLAADPRFCPYLDMPLQHINDTVLNNMGRHITRDRIEQKLALIRRHLPDAALRTTFIVGYPGETEAQFEELLNFISEGHFQHVGVFTFSPEPGTPAAELPDSVPANEKVIRQQALMEAQLAVSRRRLQNQIGETRTVMLDDPIQNAPDGLPEDITWIGRTQQQALDVDGIVWIRGLDNPNLQPGTRLTVKIEAALDYDLVVRAGPVPAP